MAWPLLVLGAAAALKTAGAISGSFEAAGKAKVAKIAARSQAATAATQAYIGQRNLEISESTERIANTLAESEAATSRARTRANALVAEAGAAMADLNAQGAERQAQSALYQGERAIAALTLQSGQLAGKQRAALAANGIDLGEGSAAELQASTDTMAAIDVSTLAANAANAAWGYRSEAVNSSSQAAMSRVTAEADAKLAEIDTANRLAAAKTGARIDALAREGTLSAGIANANIEGAWARAQYRSIDPKREQFKSLLGSSASVASSWYSFGQSLPGGGK